jgi:ankyrin repeat protein
MKIVREHINEKFVEDSDPVRDMGIGVRVAISNWMKENKWSDTDDNALVKCAYDGKLEWVKFLLAYGANISYSNKDYAVEVASQNGYLEIVKELLKAGANVNSYNSRALEFAKANDHYDIVKVIKDHITNENKSK